ncbi:cytochrome C [Azospirillum sp. TSH100]|uniref:c-type cytochrome n=1 Tax=Azospirillum sp. TSH100 TaxID=652764 RepID=UPI000D61D435|nr:cytochrome c [Azospirillum sp. TSH100]PWC89437.1 cytochrome C [Azospirillum sp. TSH100]
MTERFTKAAARNIFYGGSLFFFATFVALTALSHNYVVNTSTDKKTLTEAVARGKHVWEKNSCINCHTLLGEGAYFAPELGNVWLRYGGDKDPEGAVMALKSWMAAQPSGIEGRRQMPQFHLTDSEVEDLAAFLEWTSRINTQNWPPKLSG